MRKTNRYHFVTEKSNCNDNGVKSNALLSNPDNYHAFQILSKSLNLLLWKIIETSYMIGEEGNKIGNNECITCLLALILLYVSHLPWGVPSAADGACSIGPWGWSWGCVGGKVDLEGRGLEDAEETLYNRSSSWAKCCSSSWGRTVTPHTGQQDGSEGNFFLPEIKEIQIMIKTTPSDIKMTSILHILSSRCLYV